LVSLYSTHLFLFTPSIENARIMKLKMAILCWIVEGFMYMNYPEAPEITGVRSSMEYQICMTTFNVE